MKFPLSLLKMFLTTDASLEKISDTLTAIGLEVDGIEDKSGDLKQFVVAEILSAERHPQADKLQVCQVNTAQGTLQIVCGAPNARAGIKVALANIGTIIPTNGMEIKKAAVRGVESQGMMCSARELGLGEDHAGIIELPLEAEIGASIVDVLHLNDPVLDINVTANRGDCMGVVGIARDLAAAGLGTFTQPLPPESPGNGDTYPISIEDTDGCPAFLGRVIRGVSNGPSPEWLQRTLTAAGMRPISVLVDLTNFATLAYGRPAHVYDLKKLQGPIVVRCAKEGEQLAALNEKTYTLAPRDLVIADDSGAIGLGGIMGGASTAVDENTTDILLELALFNPLRIAHTGRALQINSDARSRFERGVDEAALEVADRGLTAVILDLAGGAAGTPVLVGEIPQKNIEVPFSAAVVNALGGTAMEEARMRQILTALGFRDLGDRMAVPSWRHDVSQPADLAEEVLRIVGYDAIPAVSLPKSTGVSRASISPVQTRVATVRRGLAARGLHETYGWGFCSAAQAAAFGGQPETLELLNPISAELSVMRPNLLPHLLTALSTNRARGAANLALFEVGATFADITPTGQRTVAAGVRTGLVSGLHWNGSAHAGVFDVKADALAALEAAGLDSSKLMITRNVPAWYHPGRSGAVGLGPKNILAYFGELHPQVLKALDIEFPVMAFEVMLDALPAAKAAKRKAATASEFQPVARDFAFVMEQSVPVAELVAAVNKAEKTLLRDVTIFDVYTGKGIEPGQKSIAFTVTLQADDRTLTDAEIEAVSQNIITNVRKIGATLRA